MEFKIRFAINDGSMLGDMTTMEVETLIALSRVMPGRDADVFVSNANVSGFVKEWRLVENFFNHRPELEVTITLPVRSIEVTP